MANNSIINEPWVEKYRPSDLGTIISHDRIKNHVTKYIDQGALPNLLFHGPAGVGKTTLIKSIARQLYGDKYSIHVIEINASDDNGVEVIRQRVNSFVSAESLLQANKGINIPKLIILDECDQMSSVAQGALRRIIELASAKARFCLICNQVSKIIPPLQSRCAVFRFKLVQPEDMKLGLQRIIDAERLQISSDALNTIIKVAHGDMRQSVNLLQAVWLSAKADNKTQNKAQYVVQKQDVIKVSGKPDEEVCNLFMQPQTFQDRYGQIKEIIENGVSLEDFIEVLVTAVLSNSDYTEKQKRFLLIELGNIDEALQSGADLQSQTAGLIAAFTDVQN